MTRRLLFRYALGSTTGAGGIGAAEAAAGAGAGALVDVPQLLHELQPVSQPVSQQDFLAKSFDKSPFFLPQPLSHPQGSQALISHPQVGAALQGSQAFTSQPQVGAAPQPQPVSQQVSHPLPTLRTLHATLRSMSILAFSTRPNSSKSGLRRGLQHVSHVAGPQLFISQPQLGAAPQGSQALTSQPQDGPFSLPNRPQPFFAHGSQAFTSQPQLGAALQGSQALTSHPQDGPFSLLSKPQPFLAHGSQAFTSQPQLGSAAQPVSQHELSQPLPFRPSMRSNSPPPKDGVHRLAPSIRDPINMFHFIESQLPKR